jgi:hypothetical protein
LLSTIVFLFSSSLLSLCQDKYAPLNYREIQIEKFDDSSMLNAYTLKFINTTKRILEFHYFFKYARG